MVTEAIRRACLSSNVGRADPPRGPELRAELGQELLMGSAFVMLRPFASFRQSLLVRECEWFVIDWGGGDRGRRDQAAVRAYQSRPVPGPAQAARSVCGRVLCLPPAQAYSRSREFGLVLPYFPSSVISPTPTCARSSYLPSPWYFRVLPSHPLTSPRSLPLTSPMLLLARTR